MIKNRVRKEYRGSGCEALTFSRPLYCVQLSGQIHGPTVSPLRKSPGVLWIGGWVRSGTGLDVPEKRKLPLLAENAPAILCPWSITLLSYCVSWNSRITEYTEVITLFLILWRVTQANKKYSICCEFFVELHTQIRDILLEWRQSSENPVAF
jgi:hypothetical protein